VIITITSSFAPTLMADHVSARHASRLHGHRHQGQAGGRGRAAGEGTVFTDEVAQSVSIGEAQHAVAKG
jgi:alanine dehydrogenase